MKGLLIKDFSLLKGQKKFFIMVGAIAVAMAFFMKNATMILGYLTLILPSFSLSTISYDEFDNGNTFLFTLPISRATYAMEKYCFAMILGTLSMMAAVILTFFVGIAIGDRIPVPELFLAALAVFAVMLVMQSVMLPLQLKFGSEKGRIAMFAVVGAAVMLGYGVVKILEVFAVDVNALAGKFMGMGNGVLCAAAAVIVAVILLISMKISITIMNQKEF